jgi:hypothetical protein
MVDVRHPRDANELLEVARDELRSIVGDDPRLGVRVLLLGSFQNPLDVGFLHRLPQIPMHQKTTASIQHTTQVIERARQVDIGNIDVPVLVRLQRLFEAGALRDGFDFQRDSSPACCRMRHTLAGLTATTS